MKQKFKRTLAWLLTAALVIGAFPTMGSAAKDPTEESAAEVGSAASNVTEAAVMTKPLEADEPEVMIPAAESAAVAPPVVQELPTSESTRAMGTGTPIPDGVYMLSSCANEAFALSVSGEAVQDGANVVLRQYINESSQKFVFERQSDSTYYIRNVHSNLYLGVSGKTKTDCNVWQMVFSGNAQQKWYVQDAGNGYWYIRSCYSDLYLSNAGSSVSEGTNAETRTGKGYYHQMWKVTAVPTLTDGPYQIHCSNDTNYGWCLEDAIKNGANVRISTETTSFTFKHNGDGLYTIRYTYNPNSFLDVSGGGSDNGTNIHQWEGPNNNQLWRVIPNADGTYSFVAYCNNKYADMSGGGAPSEGANIQIWEGNGTSAQRWVLMGTYYKEGVFQFCCPSDSNYVMEVADSSTTVGTPIRLGQKGRTAAQRFAIEHVTDCTYTIRDLNSNRYVVPANGAKTSDVQLVLGNHESEGVPEEGRFRILENNDGTLGFVSEISNKYIDLDNGVAANNTKIHTWDPTGGFTQQWRLVPVTVGVAGTWVVACGEDQNYVMSIEGQSTAAAANVQVGRSNGSNSQRFRFIDGGDGYYVIQNVNSGRNLNVAGNSIYFGTNIIQYANQNTASGDNERWTVIPHYNGVYSIAVKHSGALLTRASTAYPADGTNIYTYFNSGSLAPRCAWRLCGGTPTDNDLPSITDVRISELSGMGYRVTCHVSDSNGISSVVLRSYAEIAGNIKTYDVNCLISADGTATGYVANKGVGGYSGTFVTDIYAYDRAGKSSRTEKRVEVPYCEGFVTDEYGTRYYKNNVPFSGWVVLDGVYYYFQNDGYMVTGWHEIDGWWRYFDEDGATHVGWLNDNGNTYYFKSYGGMVSGWQSIDGKQYFFSSLGVLRKGVVQVHGDWHFLDEQNGRMCYGWAESSGGKRYYADTDGLLVTGWQYIDGMICYFTESGDRTGELVSASPAVTNIRITDISSSGYRITCTLNPDFKVNRVVFPTYTVANGEDDLVQHTGTLSGNTATCYISFSQHRNETGTYRTSIWAYGDLTDQHTDDSICVVTGTVEGWNNLDGKIYYVVNGAALVGLQEIGGKTYYFDGDGTMQTGWVAANGAAYYFNERGEMQTGWINTPDGNAYYTDESGMRVTGWRFIDGEMHFFDPLNNGIHTETQSVLRELKATEVGCSSLNAVCSLHPDFAASRVEFSVWTQAGGKDDLQTVTVNRPGTTAIRSISVADHNNESGRYNIMATVYAPDGSSVTAETISTVVLDHSLSEKVLVPATCTSDGSSTFTCDDCGYSYTAATPKTGHSWNDGTVIKPASCTESGMMLFTCYSCGTARTEVILSSGSHEWDSGVIIKLVSCTEAGTKIFTCRSCGTTRTEYIAPTGHTPGTPVDNHDGTHSAYCASCGQRISTAGHSYVGGSCACGAKSQTVSADNLALMMLSASLEDKIKVFAGADPAVFSGFDSWYAEYQNLDSNVAGTSISGRVEPQTVSKVTAFEFPVNVCQMTDRFSITLYGVKNGVTYRGKTYTISIEQYLLQLLPAMNSKLRTMTANLMEYGAKVQTYFNYRLDHLANDELGSYASLVEHSVPSAKNEAFSTSYGYQDAKLAFRALSVGASIQLQYIYTLKTGVKVTDLYALVVVDGKTTRVEGKDFVRSGSYYAVIFEDLLPTQADKDIRVTIYHSNGAVASETYTDRLAYAAAAYQTTGNVNLTNAINAMLNYYRLAEIAYR